MSGKNNFIASLPDRKEDLQNIEKSFGKKLDSVSKGRFGIYQILLRLKTSEFGLSVMVPVYCCSSIPWAIQKAGFNVFFYDINSNDLNGDLESIKKLHKKTNSRILLIPSLYGNPANLFEIETYCRNNNIFMIDDAAQSFGAKIDGRWVGSFGNAGLFSFSAGKPTYGHLGCYFWSDIPTVNDGLGGGIRKRHIFYHLLEYYNFFYNRYADYNSKRLYRISLVNLFKILAYKIIDISKDDLYDFEKDVLLKVVYANLTDWHEERARVICEVSNSLRNSSLRLVTSERGESNNNKIICIASNKTFAESFKTYLKKNDCYCSPGYKLLDTDLNKYKIANDVYERVVEVPITPIVAKNTKIIELISNWVQL